MAFPSPTLMPLATPHNVGYTRFISTGYGYGGYGGYGAYGVYGKREAEADAYYGAVPSLTVGGYTQVASPFHYGYGIGVYGKREAEADAYYGAVPSLTVGGYTQVASPFHYGY